MSGLAIGTKDTRYRIRFDFWLNALNDLDSWLADECARLLNERKFTATIRNALRLLFDLQNGQTDVLRELFPHVLTLPTLPTLPTSTPASPQNQVNTRRDADVDLLGTLNITQAKSDENPGFNMMISMSGLTGKWGDLPTDVLEYGKAKGRIPAAAEAILKERDKPVMAEIATTGDPKPLAGANIEFTPAPNDDDIEIPWGE